MDSSPAPLAGSRPPSRRLRLVAPRADALPRVLGPRADRAQTAVLSAALDGQDLVVHGCPGSGRSSLALEIALEAAQRGTVLLMAPRRADADRHRDAVALSGAAATVRVATPAAFAFAIVRAAAIADGRGEPSLVTGAEQDLLVRELVATMPAWEARIDPAATTLPGFRAEIRDLLARAQELGLGPAALEARAREHSRPIWADASRLMERYRSVLRLESATALDAGPRLDSSALLRTAASTIARAGTAPGPLDDVLPRTVVVDDAQDLTAAGVALVTALRGNGAQVVLLACPDAAVETFRGAVPDAAARIVRSAGGAWTPLTLRTPHRTVGATTAVIDALRGRLPLAGAPADSRRPPSSTGTTGRESGVEVSALRAPSALEEARWIATALRLRRHEHGVEYDEMAVVCRSGSLADEVADLLARQGIPTSSAQRVRPLREEPAVTDLLDIVEIGLTGTEPSAATADALLRGPYGDADGLRLRRIRRLLLAAREEGDDDGTTDDSSTLLARALVADEMPGLPGAQERDRAAAPVHRIRRMIAAVRALPADAAATDALWAAWDAAQLAQGWQKAAIEADPRHGTAARALLASHRLDAVGALFAAADRFAERRPDADALVLAEQIRAQTVAEDTLAPRATVRGRVRVLTPAAIAGQDLDTVILARVQDGVWPNTRLRSTLFGAEELALVADAGAGPLTAAQLRAMQRETVVADELRLAVSAIARARSRVLVTAVDDADATPSALLDAIEAASGPGWIDAPTAARDPGPAPDPRRLVASVRRALADQGLPEDVRAEAARSLARLRDADAPGADPDHWYHVDPSSDAPMLGPDQQVRLSPSALERARECPQSWLLERAGGTPASGPAQLIGTAVHALAEQHPDGDTAPGEPGLPARLAAMLAPLHLDAAWSTRRLLMRAEDAVRKLADHLRQSPPALALEAPFAVEHGGVQLRGSIDRIEGDSRGLRVVDLKTGRAAKSARDAERDLQLAAYQLAVTDGALAEVLGPDAPEALTGAELVYVGTPTAKAAVRRQGPLALADDPGWFETVLEETARDARGDHVRALRSALSDRCPVRRTCGHRPEGEQL